MRARSIASTLLIIAACTGCNTTETGAHHRHSLRFHGGTHEPWDDVVRDLTTGTGSNKAWGVEYVYSEERGRFGFEGGLFQSLSDGEGNSLMPALGPGTATADKQMNEFHLGLNYPFQRFWGLETEVGFGLAYIDTKIKSQLNSGEELLFADEGVGAYVRAATMLPLTEAIGLGIDLRYLAPFQRFEDEQQGVSFDANLRQIQATIFLALSW